MLTLAKIETYRAFDGNIDGYVRSDRKGDSSDITEADWALIDRLLTAIHIIETGKATEQFVAKTEQELQSHTSGPAERSALRRLAQGKHFS